MIAMCARPRLPQFFSHCSCISCQMSRIRGAGPPLHLSASEGAASFAVSFSSPAMYRTVLFHSFHSHHSTRTLLVVKPFVHNVADKFCMAG